MHFRVFFVHFDVCFFSFILESAIVSVLWFINHIVSAPIPFFSAVACVHLANGYISIMKTMHFGRSNRDAIVKTTFQLQWQWRVELIQVVVSILMLLLLLSYYCSCCYSLLLLIAVVSIFSSPV